MHLVRILASYEKLSRSTLNRPSGAAKERSPSPPVAPSEEYWSYINDSGFPHPLELCPGSPSFCATFSRLSLKRLRIRDRIHAFTLTQLAAGHEGMR